MNKGPNILPNSWDYRDALRIVIRYWYLFVISLVVIIPLGNLYLKYVKPMYNIKTTVLIKDQKNKQIMDDILSEYKLETDRNIYNEIEILKSYKLIGKVIHSLDFDISYYAKGNIRELETYGNAPYHVQLDTTFHNPENTKFVIVFHNDSTYTISSEKKGSFNGVLGEPLRNDLISLTVYKTAFFNSTLFGDSPQYYFIINNLDNLINYYVNSISIELANRNASIIAISTNGLVYEKEIDFLSKLTETYLNDELENKNRVINNTIIFIDELLLEISDSLKGAEHQLERFRREEKVVDIEAASISVYEQIKKLEEERAILLVKDRYYKYLQDYINNNYDITKIVAPSLMGIEEPMLNKLVEELYMLNSSQATLKFSAKEKNPTYGILELKIKNARKALVENIRNVLVSSEILLDDNANRLAQARSVVMMLPGKEMSLTKIKRKFNLNDNIYNYLLQKRTDASITKAANTPDNMVVNEAYLTGRISPDEKKIHFLSVLIALLLPSLFVGFKILMNNRVSSKEMIIARTNVPIIGIVGHYSGQAIHPLIEAPKSSFAESIRSLRVNLKYLATQKKNKIIGVTSTISGEGKTFFALNLATSIAISNAKVLIIGADMRKPKLHINLNMSNEKGLSNYLINNATLEEIIFSTTVANLDFIPSGPVPPNPTELLESESLKLLIDKVSEKYDYVIIDAAPVGLVADYYLLAKYTDANLYMVRHDYTKTMMIDDLNKLYSDNKLKDLFIVFNDLGNNGSYGYGYGSYGYGGYSYGYGESHGYYDETKKKNLIGKILGGIPKLVRRIKDI
ncbi:MAG: wzc [Chitinophagaceae bacterium]|nr:wzc [Chitinophagaceae bacterium]